MVRILFATAWHVADCIAATSFVLCLLHNFCHTLPGCIIDGIVNDKHLKLFWRQILRQ
jgi:hypothetical protein